MKVIKMRNRFFFIAGFFALFLLSGCRAPEVRISVGPEFSGAAIQIDFVRVLRSEKSRWLEKDVDEYFSPGDDLRESALANGDIYTIHYNVPGRDFVARIGQDDPLWNRFDFDTGRTEQDFDIIVLADLPGAFGPDSPEVRRTVIPLYRRAWSTSFLDVVFRRGLDTLEIHLSSEGIRLTPAPLNER